MREFLQLTLLQDEDPICIDDRGESVGHDEYCAVLKALTKRPLDQIVRLQVNIGCSFIEDKHSSLTNDSTRETE